MRHRIFVIIVGGVVAGLILFNIIAYNQAYAMLNFLPEGTRTKPIESLIRVEKIKVIFTGVTVPKPKNEETPDKHGLAYETHQFSSNHLTLKAWLIPAQQPKGMILLFHGYTNSKSDMIDEAMVLHKMGYSTFMVDFRGSGDSEGSSTTVGILESHDVISSFQYVQSIHEDRPTILYGRSMGAASILRALATADIKPDAIIIEATFAEMLTTIKNRFHSMGIPSFPAAQLLIFWAGIQNGFSGFEHNPAQYATKITVPTLLMHGTDDPRATIDEGERVYKALATEQKKFIRFENVGHDSYVAAHPTLWQDEVKEFLQSIQ